MVAATSVNTMTQVLSPSDPTVKDFSEHADVQFRIDDDVFHGVRGIPALDLMKFATMFDGIAEQTDVAESQQTFIELFKLVLDDESATLIISRMSDKANPVTMTQIMKILPWIMEEYGMRPTPPSSNSSDGPENPGDGTSLTENAPQRELTSSLSLQNVS